MLDQQTELITPELIASAQNYSEYREMIRIPGNDL